MNEIHDHLSFDWLCCVFFWFFLLFYFSADHNNCMAQKYEKADKTCMILIADCWGERLDIKKWLIMLQFNSNEKVLFLRKFYDFWFMAWLEISLIFLCKKKSKPFSDTRNYPRSSRTSARLVFLQIRSAFCRIFILSNDIIIRNGIVDNCFTFHAVTNSFDCLKDTN